MPADTELRSLLEQLTDRLPLAFTWLDQRNAALTVQTVGLATPVEVLLELTGQGKLGILLSSREGMGGGAPLSVAVLEQVLAELHQLIPGAELQYRSDRDGPVHPRTTGAAAVE